MWGSKLLHQAVFHHGNAVTQCHGFDLVMRHIHGGGLGALVQQLDLGPHFHAQFGVKVGQGFVKQKQFRVTRQRTPHRHPLALPARELPGLAVQQMANLQHGRNPLNRGFAHGLGHLADF